MNRDLTKHVARYLSGFLLSTLLTLAAYYAVVQQFFSGTLLVSFVVVAGVAQALVQLICFLDVAKEGKPYWNLSLFLFTVFIVILVVFGSIWIMYNLDYRMSLM